MPASGGSALTLSRVRRWDTEHLTAAAGHWSRVATVWEDAFTDLAARTRRPGGSQWDGDAAESAQARTYADRMTVVGVADRLHCASEAARTGARQIGAARDAVLRVVEAAHAAGFIVAEDFSIFDPRGYDAVAAAVRQAAAESLATQLRTALTTLLAADAGVAGTIVAATAGLPAVPFPESEIGSAADRSGGAVQPLTTFKRDGGPPPAPADPAGSPVPFRQCLEDRYRSRVGLNAVKDGFTTAVAGTAVGVASGGAVLPKGFKPIGALGGGVLGFVGGFARGVALSPMKTLAKSAIACSDLVEKVTR